jgi:hypothetical protein
MAYRLSVLNPMANTEVMRGEPAVRPASLDGRVLGLWWNTKKGGEVALERLADHLGARFPGLRVERFNEHYPASAETLQACAERADIVIGATAD